ncbi:MAG: hypothetical protein SGBAC_005112 [Bacillariaceae sp.]
MVKFKFFGKKKSKKNLKDEPPKKSNELPPKPPPPTIRESDGVIQRGDGLTEESASDIIMQAPELFAVEDRKVEGDEGGDQVILEEGNSANDMQTEASMEDERSVYSDSENNFLAEGSWEGRRNDEGVDCGEELSAEGVHKAEQDEYVSEEDQGVFAALSDAEDDMKQEDHIEDQQQKEENDVLEEAQGVVAALGDDENDFAPPSGMNDMSTEDVAAYYDYGEAAPSIPDDAEKEEQVISTDEVMPDADPAEYYGYGDAAPSSAYREEEDIPEEQAASNDEPDVGASGNVTPTLDDPNSTSEPGADQASSQPTSDDPEQPSGEDESMSQAAKLYKAKRYRLKQRRMSMTPAAQRTERVAARQNKLLMKKLLKKEMSEEDDYIQTHLGCDDKGMCLRHPNMTIVAKLKEFRFETIQACKICGSEQKAGGHARQRKSMHMVIGDIKSLQKDRKAWRKRTKVMHYGKEYDSDEEDSFEGSNASESTKSLDSLEKITAFFAEEADEEDLSRRDDAWKEKVTGRVAQVRAWDGKGALKSNPVFAKYFRMISLGVPFDAVKQCCEFDGWDPRVMDLDPNRPLRDQLYSSRTWKKSEKEDLLLNIRLCMGQETTEEDKGNGLVEIVDLVFEAYCKKKESIETHRKEMKKQEEAQAWIGGGKSLLKKTTAKRAKPEEPQVNQTLAIMKDIEESFTKGAEPETTAPSILSADFHQSLASIGESDDEDATEPDAIHEQTEPLETHSILAPEYNQSLASIGEAPEREVKSFEKEKGPHSDAGAILPIVDEAETYAEDNMKNSAALANIMKEGLPQETSEVGPQSDKLPDNDTVTADAIDQTEESMKDETESTRNMDEIISENKAVWSDDESLDLPPTDENLAGNKKEKQPRRQMSIDSAEMYSIAGDGDGDGDRGVDRDVLQMAFESSDSLPSIGEIFDEWDESVDLIEEPIETPSTMEPGPRQENDEVSVKSDMTGDTGKRSKQSIKQRTKKNKITDIETANCMLEEKDIVVASLVSKIERLRKELAGQRNNDTAGDGERIFLVELRETRRLIAEKEVISASLEKQIKRQEYEANEKWSIIEKRTLEILRLKEQLAARETKDSKKEKQSSKLKKSSSSSTTRRSKSSSSSQKKKSSSSKDKKRSSKDKKSRSKSKKKAKRKDNLNKEYLRGVFKNFVRKLIIISRSFNQSATMDKEMSVDRKSFRRSSMRMDGWVPPAEWNDFLSDDEEDLDSKPPQPPTISSPPSPSPALQKPARAAGSGATTAGQRGEMSVQLSKKDRIPRQRVQWTDDDNICKVIFVERIPADLKKELFYKGEDIQRFRLDKFMEDHEDEFELVDEDESDYSEEWVEEEYSEEEEEIEYYDEEVLSDEGASYVEEEVVTDDDYSIEEIPAQQTRRRSVF